MTYELTIGSELTFGPLTPAGIVRLALVDGWDVDRLARSFRNMPDPVAQQLLDGTTVMSHTGNITATPALTALKEYTMSQNTDRISFDVPHHYVGKNNIAKELLTSINFLASSQVYRHCKTLTDMSAVNDNGTGAPDIDQVTFAGPQLDSDTSLPLWMLITDASARLLLDLAKFTESNDWGLASAPFAYLLEAGRIRTSRNAITSTVEYMASQRAREKVVQATAFGDMIPDDEFDAAKARRLDIERAAAGDRLAALVATLHAYDPQYNIGKEGALIELPYSEMPADQLAEHMLTALAELKIDTTRFIASRLWDTAQNMKKSFLGEINPKTNKAWNIPTDSELVLLARKCKEQGLLKLDLVKNVDGSTFDGI